MSAVPALRQQVQVLPRRRAASTLSLRQIRVWIGQFVVVTAIVASSTTLLLQVQLEQSRKAAAESMRREAAAKRAATVLKSRLDSVTGYSAVADWAASNGFVAPTQVAETSASVQ